MRILICTSPGLGHFLPVVPTAWAARAAGHEILVASTGPALQAAAAAGLLTVDTTRDTDVAVIFRTYMAGLRDNPPDDPAASTVLLFAQVSDALADGTVEVASAWRPDVIVHTPLQGAGTLAAARLGVPAVHHGLGLGLTRADVDRLGAGMRAAYDRHGVAPQRPDAVIDLCPPSMRPAGALPGQPVRYVPYSGGGMLPEWLLTPPGRPRVCVTLGSVLPNVAGVDTLRTVIKVLGDLPVEVVLALGSGSPEPLRPLPDNVRPAGWVPFSELLPTCTAIVHHGGAGTAFNALVAGVPQLALPHAGDQHQNAAAVHRRGAGLVADPHHADPAAVQSAVRQLLEDPVIRTTTEEVHEEINAEPPPATVVSTLSARVRQ